jgi:UDP-N-acetylmuramoyl-tripeptide--D-alanyl-D-alanine ligase
VRLSLAEVLTATGGGTAGTSPSEHASFGSYHTSSQVAQPGGLFFALRGASLDGHTYCADAVARGAAGVVVDRDVGVQGAVVIKVADAWRALYDLAGHVLRQVSPLVVGITGSNGKTSTKEMTAAVLGVRHRVLKTEGNLNTETGLPLTILQIERHHTAAVLEMGMQRPGDMTRLADLARPRIGIVTMIGSVHLEYFESAEGLARAKGELVTALPPEGLALLNADDDWFGLLRDLSTAPVLGFGLEAGDFRAEAWRPLPAGGSMLSVDGVQVRVGLDGRHQARNALAALAAGRFAGVPLTEAAGALAGVRVGQRLEVIRARGGYTVVDDSYNASPESMLAAFELLRERPRSGRLLAVLGEMRELGQAAPAAHELIGRQAREVFDEIAILDAGHGRLLAHAAGAVLVADKQAVVRWARDHARPGDVVLVKASHGVGLQEVVQELVGAGKTDLPGGDSCP